jgi:hypothetical protein
MEGAEKVRRWEVGEWRGIVEEGAELQSWWWHPGGGWVASHHKKLKFKTLRKWVFWQ